MRTGRAWAIARADGSVQTGTFGASRFQRVPLLRVIFGIFGALAITIRRVGRGRQNRRFFLSLLVLMIAMWPLDGWVHHAHLASWVRAIYGPLSLLLVIGLLKVTAPAALWRYHGAEHKAVAAYEHNISLDDPDSVMVCSRIHDRCGTNLVFLIGVISLLPLPSGGMGALTMLALIGLVAEILGFAVRQHPRSVFTRILVGGGRFLQRALTTREPQRDEVIVACTALKAALAEHANLAVPAATG